MTSMTNRRSRSGHRNLTFEQCEDRALLTLIFVLSGNAFSATRPTILTANAAQVLERAGNQAVQISTPKIETAGNFYDVARQIESLSHGSPIGIVGFSSGGALAARLSGVKSLHVIAALDYYGPPSLSDYLNYHNGDLFDSYMLSHVHFERSAINVLSGPTDTSAYVVFAFGLYDRNVAASVSTSSLQQDFPTAHVYYYAGGHGVSIDASPQALHDFLVHV
jgi:dienelactone hydrolase